MSDERDIELSIVALENLSEIERPGTDGDGSHLDSHEVTARLSNEQNQQINQAQELLRLTLGSDEHSLDKEVEARLNRHGFKVLAFEDGLEVTAEDWKLTL